MKTSILVITSFLLFTACKSGDNSLKVSVFNAVPGASQPTVEINGDESSDPAVFGELISNYKVDPGENTINLISPGANNPLASFEGDIEEDNTAIFFTATNAATSKNSFKVSSSDLPDASNSSAQIRFTNASSIPDTVRFVITESGSSSAPDTTAEVPYSNVTDFSEVDVQLGGSTGYTITAIALREVPGPFGSTSIEYVNLASTSVGLQGTQVLNFVFYGFESVTSGLVLKGIVED